MFTVKNKNFMNNYILHLRRKLFFYKTILHIPNLKTATKTSLRNGINFFFCLSECLLSAKVLFCQISKYWFSLNIKNCYFIVKYTVSAHD